MTDTTQIQANLEDARNRVRAAGNLRQKQAEVLKSLQAAGKIESDVSAEIAELDRQENAAMAAWAAAGATGDAPAFDHSAREDLNRLLIVAQAKSRAAAAAAGPVQAGMLELNSKMKFEVDNLTVCAMAVLTAEAENLGEAYRDALIAVEQKRIYLQTLDSFLASKQDIDNGETTAFLPQVQPHIAQRDLMLEPIRLKATNEANAHWNSLWSQSVRVPA